MSSGVDPLSAANGTAGQLYYCARCARMITPPGSEGVVTPAGRFCKTCAPAGAAASATRVASASTARTSAHGIRQGRAEAGAPVAETLQSRPEQLPELTAEALVEPPSRRIPLALLIGGGIFLLGLSLLIGALVLRGREPDPMPDAAAPAPPQVAEAPPPRQKANEAASTDSTLAVRRGPGFLQPIDVRPAAPSVSAPAVPAPPAPKVLAPAAVPRPSGPPKPAVSVADQVKAFDAGLKKAADACNACKFSTALKHLSDLKAAYAAAGWWEARHGDWSQAEREVQEQLADYNNEAADTLRQVQKSSDPSFLDKVETVWKPRAAGGGESGGWALLEIVSLNAASGATLTRQSDGSILVSGNNPPTDRYTVVARTGRSGVTGFRLEALPDPSLPGGGPGRSPNGNFAASTFAVDCAPLANPARTQRVALGKASHSFAQAQSSAANLLDERDDTWWGVHPEMGKPNAAVFETATPVGPDGGAQFTCTLDCKTQFAQHGLGRFRILLTDARNPPEAGTPAGDIGSPGPAGDELGGKPASQILAALRKARARVAEQQREKRLAELDQQLEAFEKQFKSRTRGADQILKTLDGLDAELAKDLRLAEKLAERAAAVRFDATLAVDGELCMYKTTVKPRGGAVEVLYDFSTPEQFQAWYLDNPANCGGAEYDEKSKAVRVKTFGGHNWDARDRRGVPVLRLPFHLRPESWSFEAGVSLVSDAKKKDKPDYGILVWDGSAAVVRFSVREQAVREMQALVAASMPGRDNYWSRPTGFAAQAQDRVRLQMVCEQGSISCLALSAAGGAARLNLNFKLGFEPRYLGFFVRTNDGGENACVSFDNARLIGIPNREKLKELADAGRNTARAAARVALEKRKAFQGNIAPSGKASSLRAWKPDGPAGPSQAAIDNNPETYWDEEDGKPDYAIAVIFDQAREVNAISLVGWQQHSFAPKDFDIVADGKVVKEVRNALYTANHLRVEFPATSLKALELRITGYYGGSPAIRELGIYEP